MDRLSGHRLFFKCELFQTTGSFKARGATNACAQMKAGEPVVTHSSGNHAQALAFAAAATGRRATVVMPDTAPLPKRAATESYGATVQLCAPADRAAAADRVAAALHAKLVHPSEDPDVIAGQGTAALEALEQIARLLHGEDTCGEKDGTTAPPPLPAEAAPGCWVPAAGAPCPLDCLVVPVGGGGLAAGCATAAKALFPSLLVVGAEPLAMDDACRSKAAGSVQGNAGGATTVADGLRTTLGPNTWPVVRDKVDLILTVAEADILSATALVWSRMKLQVEPSAGVGVAVALGQPLREWLALTQAGTRAEGRPGPFRVGVVLCGGNADPVELAPLFAAAPAYPAGALVP